MFQMTQRTHPIWAPGRDFEGLPPGSTPPPSFCPEEVAAGERALIPVPAACPRGPRGPLGLSQLFAPPGSRCSRRAGRRWSARWPSTSRTGTSWPCATPTCRACRSDRSRSTPTCPWRQVPPPAGPSGRVAGLPQAGSPQPPGSKLAPQPPRELGRRHAPVSPAISQGRAASRGTPWRP